MVRFMVMEKTKDGKIKGHYEHDFQVVPRTGEYVTMNDAAGQGHVYQVIAVVQPMEPTHNVGDLYITHVSDVTYFHTII